MHSRATLVLTLAMVTPAVTSVQQPALTAERDATIPELIPMRRELLEQPVKLRTHREKREADVYLLTIADPRAVPGPGFRLSTLDCVAMRRAPCAMPLATAVSAQPIGFDVVSIKRNLSGSDDDQVSIAPGGRLTARNVMIRELIREVYRIQDAQLTGGPEWLATDRWDIQATGARAANRSQMIDHVKTLLRERFALRVHTEIRDAPHYALTLARGDRRPGRGLEPDTADCAALPLGDPACAAIRGGGLLRMSAAPMSDVAFSLSRMLDRPAVDRTGLAGTYRFELKWDPNAGSPTRATADGVSLFTAVREQLGLSLEAQRGPVEFLVIDAAERPVED